MTYKSKPRMAGLQASHSPILAYNRAMNKTQNPDFKKIVNDLVFAGWRETAIAKAIGVTQPTISQIKHGKILNTRYDIGVKLIALHKREMKKFLERRSGPKSAARGS